MNGCGEVARLVDCEERFGAGDGGGVFAFFGFGEALKGDSG
jgi:hypothetical protein